MAHCLFLFIGEASCPLESSLDRPQGGSYLFFKLLSIRQLNLMLDNGIENCFAWANAQENISSHRPRRSGGIGSGAGAIGAARRARSVGPVGQRTSLSQECPLGWGTALLCGRVPRTMGGAFGMVSRRLSFEGARYLDWM